MWYAGSDSIIDRTMVSGCGGQRNSLPDTIWHDGRPGNYECVYVFQGKLFDTNCRYNIFFLCDHNLVLEEEKTWEEALDHCRAPEPDALDLLNFKDKEELAHIQDVMAQAQTEDVWISLRWLAGRWLWMDQSAGGIISLPECPTNGNHCGTLSGGGQQARSCVEKRGFFCRKLPRLILVTSTDYLVISDSTTLLNKFSAYRLKDHLKHPQG